MRKIPIPVVIISIIILTSIVVYSADAAGIPKKAISTVAQFMKTDLPTTTVFTDQANTYTAGQKQTFQSSSTTAGVNLAGVASDPSGVAAGDVWRNTASDALKVRGSSITQTIPTLENTETFTGTTTLNSLTLGGDANAGSHKITSLAAPTSATDAARANTLQTKALATGTCSNGQYLAYQTSNSTWICTTLSALTSLNGDSTAAQTVAGTTGNVTVTNAGATHTINLGNNAVVNNLANTYTAGKKQTFQSSSTTAGVNLAGVASDPSGVTAGDVWRNTASDALKVQGSSTTKTIPAFTGTCSNSQILSYSTATTSWVCMTPPISLACSNSLSTAATSLTCSSIPSYRYYRVMMNVTGLAAAGYVGLQFNGDSTSGHYAWFGESAGQAQKASSISDSKLLVDDPKASFSVARLAVCDIWDSTTSGAFVQCNVSYDNTATTQYAIQGSGFWTGTTQINSITVLTSTGGNLNSGTGITILGIVS